MGERIWYTDVRQLFAGDRWMRLVPRAGETLAAQLNAVVRFALLYAAAVLLFGGSTAVVYVPVVVATLTYAVHAQRQAMDEAGERALHEASVERDRDHPDRLCTKPTRDNPYMNVLMSDYTRLPARPAACDSSSPQVSERAERHFRHNLYSDQDDVYGRATGSRQFYTTAATTIPNDQMGFAKWLYARGPTCKERGLPCAQRLARRHPVP